MTQTQIDALTEAGREIARGWLAQPDLTPDPDYTFTGDGDWQYVREVARSVGVAWDEDAAQPDEADVWGPVTAGYREVVAEARQ